MGFLKSLVSEIENNRYEVSDNVVNLLYSYARRKYHREDDIQVFVSKFCELLDGRKIKTTKGVFVVLMRAKGEVVDVLRKNKTVFWVCNNCGNRSLTFRAPSVGCNVCWGSHWSFKDVEETIDAVLDESLQKRAGTTKTRVDWLEIFMSKFSKNVLECDDLPLDTARRIISAVESGTMIRELRNRKEILLDLGAKRNRLYLPRKFFVISRRLMEKTLEEMAEITP